MKIWHISDTHGYEYLLDVPKGIDCVVFSGDAGNVRSPFLNQHEVEKFLLWFSELNIPNKIMIAGNHDSSLESKLIKKKRILKDFGVHYLEDEGLVIEGVKFYGSPWSPTFNNWSFNMNRNKLNRVWDRIPEDTDILITHTPPKGILDLSEKQDRSLEMCGCSALMKRVLKLNLKAHLYGHIHNCKDIINAGTQKLSVKDTVFSNGSVVTDGKFGKLSSNGNIIEI